MVYKFDGQTAELVRSLKVANSSYAHSFGYIEGDVAVIMKQPVFASAMQMMTQGTLKALGEDTLAAHSPLRRLGDDEDLKGVCVLYASDAGKHITGQWLAVDGGVSVVTGG